MQRLNVLITDDQKESLKQAVKRSDGVYSYLESEAQVIRKALNDFFIKHP